MDEIAKRIPKAEDYIKVSEAYAMFGISRDTLYRLIRKGVIPYINMETKRIRLSKEELMKMYPLHKTLLKNPLKPQSKLYSMESKDCYTIVQACEKYHMNDSTLYLQIRKYSIPTRQIGNYVYVPKKQDGIALIKEGLVIFFHPYLIGCGYEGQYNVVVTYDELKESNIKLKVR